MTCIAAAYFYWVPITTVNSTGGTFGCGSAADPPVATFPKNVCGDVNAINQTRALVLLISGAVLAVLGLVLFGGERRPQTPAGRGHADHHRTAPPHQPRPQDG